jgi:hypothetical protein
MCIYGPDAFCKSYLVMGIGLHAYIRLACWASFDMPAASMRFAHLVLSSLAA